MSMEIASRARGWRVWLCLAFLCAVTARAQDAAPDSVTIAGSLQTALGCADNWSPPCTNSRLQRDADDDIWQASFALPAGNYEYKAALNGAWTENYGANAQPGGADIALNLGDARTVKFYYSHATHWVADDVNHAIAVAAGNFQSELGCANDWDPACLRSWLQDPDGDGVYRARLTLPAGNYEVKVALRESWAENYGANGVPGGDNIAFTVSGDCVETEFAFDYLTKQLTIGPAAPPAQPASVTLAGSLQSELGCGGDWQADCAATHLTFDAGDGVWQRAFTVPAGSYEYKAPINDAWSENYGANATRDGANIGLNVATSRDVKFYYSHATHWIVDNLNKPIAVAAGSFQSELGCTGDWDPSCLRSWLQDPDGDGNYSLTLRLPAGDYETKTAIAESWAENYGQGGAPGGANIAFTVPQSCRATYFNYDAVTHALTIGAEPGGPRGDLRLAKAHWLDRTTLAWNAGTASSVYRLHYSATGGLSLNETGVIGGASLTLTRDPNGLSAAQRAKFPHLAGFTALKLGATDAATLATVLKGQIAISAVDTSGRPIDASGVQIPGVLDDLYTYTGTLGPSYQSGVPTLRVWAPTAQRVNLLLFDDANPATAPNSVPMTADAATGTWSVRGTSAWNRKYYLYEVQVYVPATGRVEINRVTDPYSLSLATDSARSQIVNLDDNDLETFAWRFTPKPRLDAPEDAVIYELHVRDFSINDTSVPAAQRGTFAAFTQALSDGMRHLRSLAIAGVTHVHLLPAFDFASTPERRADQATLDPASVNGLPPDSTQQQAAVAAIQNRDGFNWGYDPWHYTVPEGSYATNPEGVTRIREFRGMVQALNLNGLRVVMDVVYNHTTASGQNDKSVLDRIVPGYYHRLNLEGGIENSSCCANTASEHAMMEKLMVDSLVTWARAYKVDGFRFDLMGHHAKANLLRIRAALDQLTVARDGVDGRAIYLYGEGWNFGEVANDARFVQATQANMAGTGIGTFSDRLRDGVRGGSPFSDAREQGFINGLGTDPSAFEQAQGDGTAELLHISDWIRIGMAGAVADYRFTDASGQNVRADQIDYFGQHAGYTADPQEHIAYIEAHDNQTLFDVDQLKLPGATSMADRVRVQNLGASVLLLGEGIPFIHAGQEILRSKSMDRDSYNSGDWFNAIDWRLQTTTWGRGLPIAEKNQDQWPLMRPLLADPALKPTTAAMRRALDHVREMTQVRKSTTLLRLRTGAQVRERVRFLNVGPSQIPGLIVMSVDDPAGAIDRRTTRVVSLINARPGAVQFNASDAVGSSLHLHPVLAQSSDAIVRTARFDRATGRFDVPGRTSAVFLARRPVTEQVSLLDADVRRLAAQGALSASRMASLIERLDAARAALSNGRSAEAAVHLAAFAAQVTTYVLLGGLSSTDARVLLDAVEAALASIAQPD